MQEESIASARYMPPPHPPRLPSDHKLRWHVGRVRPRFGTWARVIDDAACDGQARSMRWAGAQHAMGRRAACDVQARFMWWAGTQHSCGGQARNMMGAHAG